MAYVHHPPKVVNMKGQKKLKCHTSVNKAQTIVLACVNAIGQAIPPYVIYNAKIRKDGPPGTNILAVKMGGLPLSYICLMSFCLRITV